MPPDLSASVRALSSLASVYSTSNQTLTVILLDEDVNDLAKRAEEGVMQGLWTKEDGGKRRVLKVELIRRGSAMIFLVTAVAVRGRNWSWRSRELPDASRLGQLQMSLCRKSGLNTAPNKVATVEGAAIDLDIHSQE